MSLQSRLQAAPPLQFGEMTLRSRREVVTRDAANARLFEHWQTDGPSGYNNRPVYGGSQPYMDMMPTPSRSDHTINKGVPVYDTAHSATLDTNPYFQKFDITQDPRNVARELNASVVEDKYDRGMKQAAPGLERTFASRWLPQEYASENNLTTLLAYEKVMKAGASAAQDTTTDWRQYSHWGAKLPAGSR